MRETRSSPRVTASCAWCHTVNDITDGSPATCSKCGHRADLPRAGCDCQQCIGAFADVPKSEHVVAIARGARWCYYISSSPKLHDNEHGYIPSLVVENIAGHVPMSGNGEYASPWYWGPTREAAE